MKQILLFSTLLILTFSCSNDPAKEKSGETPKVDSTLINDSLNALADSLLIDSIETVVVVPVDVTDKDGYESNNAAAQIIQANKKQLSFCECVNKVDKINTDLEDAEDEAFDKLFTELERLQKEECAVLMVSPNRTPDERAAHQRKVKKCLK